jgi:hypothetical protein
MKFDWEPVALIKNGFFGILGGVAAFFLSSYQVAQIRAPIHAQPELSLEPVQLKTDLRPFNATRHGVKYYIEPQFSYQISGLIVSYHDSASWVDITHAAALDFINTRDLCVVWGSNLKNELYRKLSFSSGDWTCYVQSHDQESWQAFHPEQLSNNHVLPATNEVEKTLADATYGDQLEMQGYLVNYERAGHPPARVSSITRTDTGNGACEIIWVTEAHFLHRQPPTWRYLRRLSLLVLLISVVTIAGGILLSLLSPRSE